MAGEEYKFGRNAQASIRLTAQHLIWRELYGWDIHPSAFEGRPKGAANTQTPLRVTDLACGNGVWLIEESRSEK